MNYRDLGFYQKAREVVQGVNAEIIQWPKTIQAQEISRQLFRSAISIGANIAEGHGRHTGNEYIHYLIIAQGSANEVDHWLNTALDCRIGNASPIQSLIQLNQETLRMLNSTITSLKKTDAQKSLRESSSPYSLNPYPFFDDDEDL